MVPYGLNQTQFVSMYQRKLDHLSDQAINRFRDLLIVPVEPEVDATCLEIFLGEYGNAPHVWAYWRGRNNKVDHKDPGLFPGKALELDLGLESLAEIDERYFVGPDQFPGFQLIAPLLSRWLAESWWKAGGWSYPVPTTLSVHDFGANGWVQLSKGNTSRP